MRCLSEGSSTVSTLTLLLEEFSMAADTLMDCRDMTWSSIRDTRGVTTSVRPNQQAQINVQRLRWEPE